MTAKFDIDFTRLESNVGLVEFFQRFGAAWQAEAQRLTQIRVNSKSKEYERAFRVELIGGSPPSLRVGNIASHAIYVEEDTPRHEITTAPPNRKNFGGPGAKRPAGTVPGSLAFFSSAKGGGIGPKNLTFAKKVNHPGTKGKHIIKDAVTAAADNL